jgi:exportin-T
MGHKGSRAPFVPLFVLRMHLTWNIARTEPLDEKSFDTLRQTLLAYIQSEYTYGLAESNAPCTSSI